MNESAVYNESDLAPFHRRLNELRQIVQRDTGDGKQPNALTKLLVRQLNECGASFGYQAFPHGFRDLLGFYVSLFYMIRVYN